MTEPSAKTSRCSSAVPINFQWFPGVMHDAKDQVDAAVEACMAAVARPGRVWNVYAESAARSEFRRRIQKATRGQLKPISQVKEVGHNDDIPLFEIRWQTIAVTELDPETREPRFFTVVVRMYHSEPDACPFHFVGHMAHEKELDDEGSIGKLQTVEIGVASKLYELGEHCNWGIVTA